MFLNPQINSRINQEIRSHLASFTFTYSHFKAKHIGSISENMFSYLKNRQTKPKTQQTTLLMLESYYWKQTEKSKGNQLHHLTKETQKKAFASFSPIVLVDLLQYLSCQPCFILHVRSPLINALIFSEQIFFFLRDQHIYI